MKSLLKYIGLVVWILMLEIYAVYSVEIKAPGLAELVERPEIRLHPQYLDLDSLPSDLKREALYEELNKSVFQHIKEASYDDAYVSLSKFIDSHPHFAFNDWLSFLKADLLMRVQYEKENGKLNLALEDYELAVRLYPLHSEIPRALYQQALIKLHSGLYQEAEVVVQRALANYPQSALAPDYYLISAEQHFLSSKYDRALMVFDLIVRKYGRHRASVDAAFRKAYLHFTRRDYGLALETYQNLEKFHAEEFAVLRMKQDSTLPIKLQDRLFYGEALFMTESFEEASEIFQVLANLFPQHSNAAYAWIRYADTFYVRQRYLAAQKLYEFVLENYKSFGAPHALARVRHVESLRNTNRIRFQSEVEKELRRAADEAVVSEAVLIEELAYAKLADYFLESKSYVKAQQLLRMMKSRFTETPNAQWIIDQYVNVLETEILDYYRSGDLLATLTTYLVNESDVSIKFQDIPVLIKIADAARELDLLDKSEEILNRVIYLESHSDARQEALLKLIDILVLKNDLKRASERLRRFSFAYPQTRYRYLYEKAWGDLYTSLDKPEKAIAHYEEALRLAAARSDGLLQLRHTYIRLGELYTRSKLPLKAIESYQNYLSIYADRERVQLAAVPLTKKDEHYLRLGRYRIADLYFNMRDYIQALGAYRSVSEEVKLEPFHSHALYRIGECYLALNDREAALDSFRKLKSDDPNNLWFKAAQSYIQSVEMEVNHGIRIFN